MRVKIISAPISDRMWTKGQDALINNDQIRVGGNWFDYDDRWEVEIQYGLSQETKDKLNPHIPVINKLIAEGLKKDSEADIFDIAVTYLKENVDERMGGGSVAYVFRPY